MFETLLEAVRGATDGVRALRDLTAIARFHRIQATPGYDEAARWLEGAIREAGLIPERIEVPADGSTRALGFPMPEGWRCRHARVMLHGAGATRVIADFATAPLSIVQRSASAKGRWPLVHFDPSVTRETTPDLTGKVALVPWSGNQAYEHAVRLAGAAGVITYGRRLMPPVRTGSHDPDSLNYTSFWWADDRPRTWGAVVTPRIEAELKQRLQAGEPLEIECDIETERYHGTIPLVTTTIPGTWPGEVLVTGHLCHPMPGANDNASGAAAVLETARVLAELAASGDLPEPRRTLRFLWMPEFTGTYAWQAARAASVSATVAAVNLDMVGEKQDDCGSTFLLERAPHFLGSFADDLLARIRSAAQDWVKDFSGEGHYSLVRMAEVPYSGGSDHALWLDPGIGVPCPMLIQWPDRYYHTDLDTPDRCDPASLALAVRSAATYAGFIARAGVLECEWLLGIVSRSARRRILAALDSPQTWWAAEGERERGLRSLASLARLGIGMPSGDAFIESLRGPLGLAVEELEGFWESEVLPGLTRSPRPTLRVGGRVPERLLPGLLPPMRSLCAGWDELPAVERVEWAAGEEAIPGGSTSCDLAWFACDGVRGIADIEAVLEREGQCIRPGAVEYWFDRLTRLGVIRWKS